MQDISAGGGVNIPAGGGGEHRRARLARRRAKQVDIKAPDVVAEGLTDDGVIPPAAP